MPLFNLVLQNPDKLDEPNFLVIEAESCSAIQSVFDTFMGQAKNNVNLRKRIVQVAPASPEEGKIWQIDALCLFADPAVFVYPNEGDTLSVYVKSASPVTAELTKTNTTPANITVSKALEYKEAGWERPGVINAPYPNYAGLFTAQDGSYNLKLKNQSNVILFERSFVKAGTTQPNIAVSFDKPNTDTKPVDPTPPYTGNDDTITTSAVYMNGTPGFDNNFADFELVSTNDNLVRDNIDANEYFDNGSPRRFLNSGRFVSKSQMPVIRLAPLGYHQNVRVNRWRGDNTSNYEDNNNPIQIHQVTFVGKGPQHQKNEISVPLTWNPKAKTWCLAAESQLPKFNAPQGKYCLMYKYDKAPTLDQLFECGLTQIWGQDDSGWQGLPAGDTAQNMKRHATGNLGVDAMGQARFNAEYTDQMCFELGWNQSEIKFFFLDLETNWPLNFSDRSKIQIYIIFYIWRKRFPNVRLGNMYQPAIYSKNFVVEGRPQPLHFVKYYTGTSPVNENYLPFNFPGGTFNIPGGGTYTIPAKSNASLFDVTDVYTIDGYFKTPSNEIVDQSKFLMQCYSAIHDGEMTKLWFGSDKIVLGYLWIQTDNDGAQKVWFDSVLGRMSYYMRWTPDIWAFMGLVYISFLRFDGVKWWHDAFAAIDDPTKPVYGPNDQGVLAGPPGAMWQPFSNGTTSPWDESQMPTSGEGRWYRYPRVPYLAPRYGLLAEWRLMQNENYWNKNVNPSIIETVPTFSLDGGQTWVSPVVGDICVKAHNQQPILYLYTSNVGYYLFTWWPFNTTETKILQVKLSSSITIEVEVVGQWPAVRPYDLAGKPIFNT